MARNDLPVAEIKRRGMAAIEERLNRGPVHLIKRNRATAVVVSEEDYLQLTRSRQPSAPGLSALQWLLANTPTGGASQQVLGAERDAERAW